MSHGIHGDLASLAVAIEDLKPLAGNPRKGDVEVVKRSYAEFGQRKPIVAHRDTREVLAGNHQLAAAKALGWSHIAVVWVDDDDDKAKAFALADNRTHDVGTYDFGALEAMLSEIASPELQLAAGFDASAVQEVADLAALKVDAPKVKAPPGEAVVQYGLVFDDEDQQSRWYDFLKALKKKYPGEETAAARLDAHIRALGWE